MKVRLLKLLTGANVLAEIDERPEAVVLKNPLEIMAIPDETTQQLKVQLVPFVWFTSDTEIAIDRTHILFIVNPDQKLADTYNQRFGNIILASGMPTTGPTLLRS